MSRIDPRKAVAGRIDDSPVQRLLAIIDDLLRLAPQPNAQTENARTCAELLGRHLLNLVRACGEMNLMGFHSSAVSLFRPMEDALDCLAAVAIIAGAAERWRAGQLKPSDAAKLWHRRHPIRDARSREIRLDYRRDLRTIFNNFAHCTPALVDWDLFRETHPKDKTLCRLQVNHENWITASNSYRIDAFLVAHCYEFLEVIELGYASYLDLHPQLKDDLESLKTETVHILKEKVEQGLLDTIVPPEIEGVVPPPAEKRSPINVKGKWTGHWECTSGHEVKDAKLLLEQDCVFVSGSLTTEMSSEEGLFTVVEQMTGIINEQRVSLDGVSSEVRPPGRSVKYTLDTFQLRCSTDGKRLVGMHSCGLGTGEAVFERT